MQSVLWSDRVLSRVAIEKPETLNWVCNIKQVYLYIVYLLRVVLVFKECLTTSQNLQAATDHVAHDQQRRQRPELVEKKNTEKEDSKTKDFDRKQPDSRWEERRDNRPNSFDRRDYDRRNDYGDYHNSQHNWYGGYSQAGYNQAEYSRQNNAGRPQDRWGFQGQGANRYVNFYSLKLQQQIVIRVSGVVCFRCWRCYVYKFSFIV